MKSIYKTGILLVLMLMSLVAKLEAKIKNPKTETYKILGNCDMCKKHIETASFKKNISIATWNESTKMVLLTFDAKQTNADELLKRIAYAGYDNDKFLAPDAAYNKLAPCCQYERMEKKVEVKTDSRTEMKMHDSVVKKSAANPLSEVYASYFLLKDALTKDNGVLASAKAKELFNAINTVSMEKLPMEQHMVWMQYEKKLSYDAEHIKGVDKIEHQREHFISLSRNMFEVMKVIKNDATVYYDYCPMANDGKGANWLSLQQPISNPYMGKAMPTCGKVQETIK